MPILSILVWLPILASSCILLVHRSTKTIAMRYAPLLISLSCLVLTGIMLLLFQRDTASMQFAEHIQWMPNLGIEYALGVDGIAILLVALTVFMNFLVVIAGFTHVDAKEYTKYCAIFLIMQGLMCGVFLATDAILFYLFFEAMMIPLFLIIGLWGGPNRIYATFKFFLYTLLGSLFLLVAIIYLGYAANAAGLGSDTSFGIIKLQTVPLDLTQQKWLFWALLLGFAVKIPMWPVHTWLPDAHVEAPTGGSVILAAITLKVGGYAMLRFLLPIVPDACIYFSNLIIILSLIAIIYIGLVSIMQDDLKKLIAYSSIAHMGFVTLGLFVTCKLATTANAVLGIDGAVLQMLSHGFISGALFLCVGVLYSRMHTRKISDYGGIANSMPVFASFFMLFALANVGMPGTMGFVGEFLVILISFKAGVWYAILAALSLVLGVAYTLWMYKRVVFGTVQNSAVAMLRDLAFNERVVLGLLAAAILLFGVWPNPVLNILHSSTAGVVMQLEKAKIK